MRLLLVITGLVAALVSCTTEDGIGGLSRAEMVDPGCTNNDCPPDPGCTNNDCPGDPGCTNNDCPPDPGCTNNDCPPDYWAGCCCVNLPPGPGVPLPDERVCCCKTGNKVTCRLSQTIVLNKEHEELADETFFMGQVPSTGKGTCAPPWYPEGEKKGGWWPNKQGCGWMKQIHKCGPLTPED